MERLFFCMIPQTISGLFKNEYKQIIMKTENISCLLYTSDAADEL